MTSHHRIVVGLALAILLPFGAGAFQHPSDDVDARRARDAEVHPTDRPPQGSSPIPPDADPTVLEELERGRYWHASRLLASKEDGSVDPLLRARAEAGWGNWPVVWRELESLGGISGPGAGEAWTLRGRAAEELGRNDEAARSYRAALESGVGLGPDRASVVRIRLARVLAEAGSYEGALGVLDRVVAEAPGAGSWLALEIGGTAAEAGRVGDARRAIGAITDREAERRSWNVLGRAHLVAGDTAAALAAYLERAGETEDGDAWSRLGSIRLAMGDSGAAGRAFRNALDRGPNADAARELVGLGLVTPAVALRAYRALSSSGEDEIALRALERHAELVDGPLPDDLRLERAQLLAEAGRQDEAVGELRELASREEAEVAAPALELWARVLRRQGRAGEGRALQDRLVERFPSRPEAVDVVFFRADDRHDAGDLAGALGGYRRAVTMAPELDRAGLARMRMGQLHLTGGRHAEAVEVFEGYVDAFPRGRRWDEARYWAGWSRMALGEKERAREHVERIQEEDPLSYYSFLGARLLGEPFEPPIPEGSPPPDVPAIREALEEVRRLRDAGLEDAVPHRIDDLRQDYRASGDTLLRLSLELSRGGFSLDGILLGWEIQGDGREWDRWLVRAVYPFPYRELVRLEAEEWGLEPYYLAALIRQESAFLADARSGAGAMGLMQVVPSTGRSLARSVGPESFAEHHLFHPEVNLHLGAAFMARLQERFEGRTALALAAYNAGPTRARQWERRFPEAEDPLRFTERIPYRETRGYVKRVTRNLDIYRWLYGADE